MIRYRRPGRRAWILAAAAVLALATAAPALAAPAWPEPYRIDIALDGGQANGYAEEVSVSANGRYAAFTSGAGNIVPGDTNGFTDVFVRDLWLNTTKLVSIGVGGAPADAPGYSPDISADGRYVVWESSATNLPGGDQVQPYRLSHIFRRDLLTGSTILVDRNTAGEYANEGERNLGGSFRPSISDDGHVVAFDSSASNLDGGGYGDMDVFARNLTTGVTERVSVGYDGGLITGAYVFNSTDKAAVSANGRFVTFFSTGTRVVPGVTGYNMYIRDTQADTNLLLSGPATGPTAAQQTVATGGLRYVAFSTEAALVPADTNGMSDEYVRDLQAGVNRLVSVGADGTPANSFTTEGFLSANGRFVAFATAASNVVSGDTNGVRDAFLRDLWTGVTRRVSIGVGRVPADGPSGPVAISADGRFVGFISGATNLVTADTNGLADAFVRGPFG